MPPPPSAVWRAGARAGEALHALAACANEERCAPLERDWGGAGLFLVVAAGACLVLAVAAGAT